MIQVYIIVSGKYTTNPTVDFNLFNVCSTLGNIYIMQLTHMHYNLCKHFFSNRIIAVWNSLPNIIVNAVGYPHSHMHPLTLNATPTPPPPARPPKH